MQNETCLHKVGYDKKTAQTVKNKRASQGVFLRIYPCPFCGFWHLTHKVGKKDNLAREVTPYKRKKFIPNFIEDAE